MEFQFLQLLQQTAGTLFSDKEVGKIMDRKEYRERPHWARSILEKMVSEGLIWKEAARYLYPTEKQRQERKQKGGKEGAAEFSKPDEQK